MTQELERLIREAINGDQPAMDQLLQQAQPRLRAYILRCTLDENLTDDIVQETMLRVVKSLQSIKDVPRFWPWLYRIASNEIASHFRKAKCRPALRFSSFEDYQIESMLEDENSDVSSKPVLKELHGAVLNAMEKLNPIQRSVVSLRCFEDMSYDQIAEAVGCRQSVARVHFFRARRILQSRLKKEGIRGGAVVPALVIFGKFTACQKTLAAGITSSSVHFSSGLTVTQSIVTAIKAGFLKGSIAAGSIAATVVLGHTAWVRTHPYPNREQVQSVHYTVQGVGLVDEKTLASKIRSIEECNLGAGPGPVVNAAPLQTDGHGWPPESTFQTLWTAERSSKANVDAGPYQSKGAYEQWLQFPDGPDGPVFVRMQRWGLDPKTHANKGKQCGWLQDGRANYYYFSGGPKRVYITNDPIGMLILPTDPPELSEFLMKHTMYQDRIEYSYDRKTGLTKSKADSRVPKVGEYKTEYAYNTLTGQDFEPFWPEDVEVIDERDTMHRRGWTYFTVDGIYNDLKVTGYGVIPFTYAAYQDHKPWMRLTIGSEIEILDTPKGAVFIKGSDQQLRSAYPAETCFTGLGRPWSGLCVFDTTRRDAARKRIPFECENNGETAVVSLLEEGGYSDVKVEYRIDMSADVIQQITFYRSGSKVLGRLLFDYAQDLETWPETPEMSPLPEWAARQPVLKPDYGLFGLLDEVTKPGEYLSAR